MRKPFLLKPSGKDYLWGGQRLNDEFEKGIEMSPLAETWECSTYPDDAYAKEYENGQLGKTEMWYVLDARRDAKLVYGFCQDTDEETIRKPVKEGTLMKHLQQVTVQKDDLFFIEAWKKNTALMIWDFAFCSV